MQHVDALSRAPITEPLIEKSSDIVMTIDTVDNEVLMFQRSDPLILEIIQILRKDNFERDNVDKQKVKDFVMRDGILFKKVIRNNSSY